MKNLVTKQIERHTSTLTHTHIQTISHIFKINENDTTLHNHKYIHNYTPQTKGNTKARKKKFLTFINIQIHTFNKNDTYKHTHTV